ncbi:MAG: glycoside hydrolase [Gammaproteobacteria bacterium]|nr:MAG: glycoside hydrolase [Gammaproteobacteria bacterium]UTW41459.1 glycosyl hydrolase 53 family protein [bacterium SCSIO 12844]
MNRLIYIAIVLIFSINMSYATTFVKGINYSPDHNPSWVNWQKSNDSGSMKSSVQNDLVEIKNQGFSVIKSFYSTYCPYNGQNCINITKLADDAGLKIYLGVYEFDGSQGANWTQAQIKAAVDAAKTYPKTVLGIVVGNEDAFDWQGHPVDAMQKRIADDMNNIKGQLKSAGLSIPVLTAQRQPDWQRLHSSDPHGIITASDVIGGNFYPFWGNSPEKDGGQSVALKIPQQVSDLSTTLGKPVMVTEEGWPSCGNNPNTQDKNVSSMNDYYNSWKSRTDNFDSMYFSFYDKQGYSNCANGDANNYFGICDNLGQTKPASSIHCK